MGEGGREVQASRRQLCNIISSQEPIMREAVEERTGVTQHNSQHIQHSLHTFNRLETAVGRRASV